MGEIQPSSGLKARTLLTLIRPRTLLSDGKLTVPPADGHLCVCVVGHMDRDLFLAGP